MTALIIVLSVLALLIILAFIRVVVIAEYSAEGFELVALAGPIKIELVPGKEKAESESSKKKKDKKSNKSDKTKAALKSDKTKKGGVVKKVTTVLPTVLKTLGRFFKHLSIDVLTVRYAISGDDPYDVAIGYGYANGALGYICPLLDRNFKIKKWDINVYPSFTEPEETMYIKAKASISIWELVYIVLKLDFKAIFSIL